MANLSKVRSKLDLIATLNPKAWDVNPPQFRFRYSDAHVELMVADAVKASAPASRTSNSPPKLLSYRRRWPPRRTKALPHPGSRATTSARLGRDRFPFAICSADRNQEPPSPLPARSKSNWRTC